MRSLLRCVMFVVKLVLCLVPLVCGIVAVTLFIELPILGASLIGLIAGVWASLMLRYWVE